jgi:hypothetical protein
MYTSLIKVNDLEKHATAIKTSIKMGYQCRYLDLCDRHAI